MFDKAFKSCMLFTVLLLAATNVAQAKITQFEAVVNTAPKLADPQALQAHLNTMTLAQANGAAAESKTITLNFGPLHFQEVIRLTPKSCPS